MFFKDSYFCISYELLKNPEKKLTTRDFNNYKRADVVDFIRFLILENIVRRDIHFGRESFSILKNPEKLLNLCIDGFKNSERKSFLFTSNRNYHEILSDLKRKNVEFYLGRFSGIRPNLQYAYDNMLTLLIPNKKYFEGYDLRELEYDLGVSKVRIGGNILLVLPRYKKFLRQYFLNSGEYKIPSDFYTFLSMTTMNNPLGKPQAENIIKKIKGKDANFLSWKK
ncbi:MAG: hypothetical protein ABII74_06885 [Elusimicrobiota bacterium]